jgi:propanediol dehydratase small subunit
MEEIPLRSKRFEKLADRLESDYEAPLTAALIREAADVYLVRGVLKPES